jgi:hypothetical protein
VDFLLVMQLLDPLRREQRTQNRWGRPPFAQFGAQKPDLVGDPEQAVDLTAVPGQRRARGVAVVLLSGVLQLLFELRQEPLIAQLGRPQPTAFDLRDIVCVDLELGPWSGAADEVAGIDAQVPGEVAF